MRSSELIIRGKAAMFIPLPGEKTDMGGVSRDKTPTHHCVIIFNMMHMAMNP